MKKNEIKDAIKKVAPKSWEIGYISMASKTFTVDCPAEYRLAKNRDVFKAAIKDIEKATNSKCTGGGMLIGQGRYDNDFTLKG